MASHTSALYLYGLPTFGIAKPHVSISSGSNKHTEINVHRLPPSIPLFIDRIATTPIDRTIVDSAELFRPHQLKKVLNEAVVGGLTSYAAVSSCVLNLSTTGKKGRQILRRELDVHLELATARSHLVLRFLDIVRQSGFTQPELEYSVFELSTFWTRRGPQLKISVELDHFGSHGKSRKRFDYDRRRNNALTMEGWTVLHITSAMTDAEILRLLRSVFER